MVNAYEHPYIEERHEAISKAVNPAERSRLLREIANHKFNSVGQHHSLGDGHSCYAVRLDRRQHLFTEAFQVPHKLVMRHGPLIEVEHQRAGA